MFLSILLHKKYKINKKREEEDFIAQIVKAIFARMYAYFIFWERDYKFNHDS